MRRTEHNQFLPHNPTVNQPLPSSRGFSKASFKQGKSIGKERHNSYEHGSYNSPQQNSQFNLDPILHTGQAFPEDLLLLLTEETSNIKNFKAKIEKEKLKVVNDMEIFKKQIIHIIQDLKISMLAQLDLCYKTYIQKYAYLKSQVQEVRMLKKQIEAQNSQTGLRKFGNVNNCSNSDMVKEIQQEVLNLRNYKISQYVNDVQRKKLSPLSQLSQELIIMTSSPFQFYDSATTASHLVELRSNFGHFTQHMFQSLKLLVRSPNFLVGKQKEDFNPHHQNSYLESVSGSEKPSMNQSNVIDNFHFNRNRIYQKPNNSYKKQRATKLQHLKSLNISSTLQNAQFKQIQNLTMQHLIDIQPNKKVELLCAVLIRQKLLVCGGRDGFLYIMALNGKPVKTLSGHKSAICTLSIITANQKILMASGGDYGCSSVLLWDTASWEIISRLQNHSAAVTSILDLGDSQTMVSGSYDKKVNVYNHRTGLFQYSLPNSKSSVFGLSINCDKTKLIVGVIDTDANGIAIWSIKHSKAGTVQSLTMQRFIQNGSVICSMISSMLNQDLVVVGCKNGKIKLWDISTGTCQGQFTVGNTPVVDMILFQRQGKQEYPLILSCGIRDISLTFTNTQTQIVQEIDVDANICMDFGCGIGPKMVLGNKKGNTQLYIVNQSKEAPQVSIYSLYNQF